MRLPIAILTLLTFVTASPLPNGDNSLHGENGHQLAIRLAARGPQEISIMPDKRQFDTASSSGYPSKEKRTFFQAKKTGSIDRRTVQDGLAAVTREFVTKMISAQAAVEEANVKINGTLPDLVNNPTSATVEEWKQAAIDFRSAWAKYVDAKRAVMNLRGISPSTLAEAEKLPMLYVRGGRFGIWIDRKTSREMWIAGDWKPYGPWSGQQRNERIEAAKELYPQVREHDSPWAYEEYEAFD